MRVSKAVIRVIAVLSVLASACGPAEKDCFRYRADGTKDKVFCDDCCKVCGSSQACGDTCISSSYQCNTSGGCACDRL